MKRRTSSDGNVNVITVQHEPTYDGKSVATYRPEADNTFTMSSVGVAADAGKTKYHYSKRTADGFALSDFYSFSQVPFMSLSGRPPYQKDPTRGNYLRLN